LNPAADAGDDEFVLGDGGGVGKGLLERVWCCHGGDWEVEAGEGYWLLDYVAVLT